MFVVAKILLSKVSAKILNNKATTSIFVPKILYKDSRVVHQIIVCFILKKKSIIEFFTLENHFSSFTGKRKIISII